MTTTDAPAQRPAGRPLEGPGPNAIVAERLDEVGSLLEEQGAGPFRVRAYHNAASAVRTLPVSVAELYRDEGLEGLERIPGVGESIARAMRELVTTGRLPMLERLRGVADPIALFRTVPGIGAALADRLHRELGLHTLEDLELAAHDGRLDAIAGFGPKRVSAVVQVLQARLGRGRGAASAAWTQPAVAELLDVDAEYRTKAEAGELQTIAPRRFNPGHRSWLPVLHTTRGPRHYTALFSNTALAHRLGRTRDWVVIYCDSEREEHQATVVTARSGALAGRRVVRGHEPECAAIYGQRTG